MKNKPLSPTVKKVLIAIGALLVIILVAFTAYSRGKDQTIATMKGGKITLQDFYEEAKKESTNQTLVRNMIIYQVFENAYGDQVTDKEVNKEYKSQASTYGSTFETQLASAGYTKSSYKDYLRQSLSFQKGLEENVTVTKKNLKTAWESFHPKVTAQIIQVSDEDTANDLLTQINDGGDFTKLAKSDSEASSASDGGKVTFNSQSSDIPDEVKTAAFNLKNGEVSSVVSSTDSSTYTTSYYIVKMTKTSSKGNDMNKYIKQIRKIAKSNKLSDSTFVTKVIRKELKAANVSIKDDDFSDVLSDYLTTTSSSTSEATSSSSSEAESSSSEAESTSSSETESTSATDSSSTAASSTTESSSAAE